MNVIITKILKSYIFFLYNNVEFREINLDDAFASELDSLRRILHFPEEVAILLSDRENDLFYDVPPLDFLRQVTLDQDGENACNTSVKKLIERFNAVRTLYVFFLFLLPMHYKSYSVCYKIQISYN